MVGEIMRLMSLMTVLAFVMGSLTQVSAAEAAGELFTNGDFLVDADGNGKPDGWPVPEGATWDAKAGTITCTAKSGATVSIYRSVPVAGMSELKFHCRYRSENLQRGSENWHDARIILNIKDAAGKMLKPSPSAPHTTGTSADWVVKDLAIVLPSDAATVEILFGVFQADGGTFTVDAVSLIPVQP
jgi:endoglucanase